jgi:hypothetical protein
MTKTYELPNEKRIMADVDEKNHTATVSVYALDDLVEEVNKYQKIEQILKDIPYGGDITVRRIQEVVEDGNDEAKVNDYRKQDDRL